MNKRWMSMILALLAVVAVVVHDARPAAAQRDIPGVPQNVELAPGVNKLTLTWQAPSSWGTFSSNTAYQIDLATSHADTPPASGSTDWDDIANLSGSSTSYTVTGTYFASLSKELTIANGTKYHVRIRAITTNPNDQSDTLPGFWVVRSATPSTVEVSPTSLTVPVGSRACYRITPTIAPTAALTITATSGATANATVSGENIRDWNVTSSSVNWKAGHAFCVKGVAVTTSPVTITHAITSSDSTFNGLTVPSVSVTVTAADTKPTIRFLHSEMRVVEGDTPAGMFPPGNVHSLSLRNITVKLDIAPAPSSNGRVLLLIPGPNCDPPARGARDGDETMPCVPYSGRATYNIDYVAMSLSTRYLEYTSGSNDMHFTFQIRSDNETEADEWVQLHLFNRVVHKIQHGQSAQDVTTVTLIDNDGVCIGSCSNPTEAQRSMIFRIIDDDASGTGAVVGMGQSGTGPPPPEGPRQHTPPDQTDDATPLEACAAHMPQNALSAAEVTAWRDEHPRNAPHVLRWNRVLAAFGEDAPAGVTALTLGESRANERRWTPSRWVRVTATLQALQACRDAAQQGQDPPPPEDPPPPANQSPTVASPIADATIAHESGTAPVSLSGVFSDADNDALAMTASSSDTAVAAASVSSDGATLTVAARARGTTTVAVTADDGNGGTVSDSFEVTVKSAPRVASPIADIALEAGQNRGVDIAGVFEDPDGDYLFTSADSSNPAVALADIVFLGTVTVFAETPGTATITVVAEDLDGNQARQAFTVTVTAPNQAPAVANPIDDATGLETGNTRKISLTGVFTDPDNDPLTITANSSNETAATASVNGTTLTVTARNQGTATVTVTADDNNGGTVADTFTVTVTAPPPPPPETKTEQPDIVTRYDTNDNNRIEQTEWIRASRDFAAGKMTYDQLLEIILVYLAS